jgi:hypothetical protein
MNRRIAISAVLLGLATPLCFAAAPDTGIRVNVAEITDQRTTSTFPAQLRLELVFTGDPVAEATTVRRLQIRRATDDLGRDLNSEKSGEMTNASQRAGNAVRAQLLLKSPSRRATSVQLIEGDVEVFAPSSSYGGIVIIPGFLAHPAEPVVNNVLRENHVDVMYLTKESFEAKKKQIAEEEKAANGMMGGFAAAFGDMFSGIFGSALGDSKDSIALLIKDPQKRIVNIELQDASGKPIPTRGTSSSNTLRQIGLQSPPPADARLVIQVATPESVRSYPFTVENIPLP